MIYMGTIERGRPETLQAKESSFSKWLKAARQRKGISGEQLAAAVGASQSMISAYERGFRLPRRERAVLLASALGEDPREALEALMADTPGLDQELERVADDEELQSRILAYDGPNPILRSASATARGVEEALMSAQEMKKILDEATVIEDDEPMNTSKITRRR